MKNSTKFLFVTSLLGASLLAACGQAATPTANSSAPADTKIATTASKATAANSSSAKTDACALLTKEAVGKVLGETVDTVTPKGLGGVCSYVTKNLDFELTAFHSGGTDYLKTTRAKLGDLALDVPGLGDEAFYNTNSIVNTLFVRMGDAAYLLDVMRNPGVQGPTPEALRVFEKALAEQLVGNLK